MYGPPQALRLLVFDAGDIYVISQLVILDEFLRRLEYKEGLEVRLHPCDYFHMMAGVGSSGIVVIFLMKLRMSIDECMEEFVNIWTTVLDDSSLDPTERSQKLDEFMKGLLKRKNVEEDARFFEDNPIASQCSAFICLSSPVSVTYCPKFRTYRSPGRNLDLTILDAARATCATPMFPPVCVGPKSRQLELISGELGFSNPIREAIAEAHQLYGANYKVSCILSLGCGRPISIPKDPNQSSSIKESFQWNAAVASQRTARETEQQIGNSKVYHRFSMERELGSYRGISPDPGVIETRTMVYLEEFKVSKELDTCMDASLRVGECVLGNLYQSSSRTFSSTYGIPPLSTSFVMRKTLMDAILEKLQSQRCLVLSGLSGIGKTQIVSKLLRSLDHSYGPILFLDASSNRSIEVGLVKWVSSFGVEYRCVKVEEALDKLAQPDQIIKNWIIVFDNANDDNDDLSRYFPNCENGAIIITTQNPFLGILSPNGHIPLDLMTEVESVEVLLKSADLGPEPSAENVRHAKVIVAELGYLPVAIVQAGYFIRVHRCIADYTDRLRDNRPVILNRDATFQRDPHYHGIYTALNVTWAKLLPPARRLMSLLTFMKCTSFPRRLLYIAGRSGFQSEPFTLLNRPLEFPQTILLLHDTFNSEELWSNQHVDDVVIELERYSLIALAMDFSEITIHFHPLVKAFAHDRLDPHERASYQAAALRLLICGSGEENQDLYELISPHIPPLHSLLVQIHVNDLAGIAMILYYEGRISEATQIWEGICDQVIKEHEEDHLQTSEVRLQLAKMYWESNDPIKRIEARILEDRVVDFRLKSLSKDHPATARAMSQRARGLEYRNKLAEAESVRLEILRIWEKQLEPNSEEILREKENLAQTYRLAKKWIDAQNLLIEIWEVRKASKGSDHWRTLRVMEALANLYAIATSAGAAEHPTDGNAEQARVAEQLWREVIEIRTKTRGPEHPDTLHALQSLAWCFELHHRDDKAEELWKRIFDCRERIQGAEHEATCQARNALAFFDYKCRRYENAEAKWTMTMEVIAGTERTKSRQSAKAMKALARLYEKTGREGARHLNDKVKSMSLTRDDEIRTRYQRAVYILDPEHKNRPDQHVQPVHTGRETQRSGEITDGVHPGYASRSDSITPSSRQQTQSSSRGTVIPAELRGLQHAPGYITDSPSYIQDFRSALRTPDVIPNKTPEANVNIPPPDIPTIAEPPDVTGDGYFDRKPLNYDGDELADCQDEETQWNNQERGVVEGILFPTTPKGDQDDDGAPPAPHPTPALVKDQSLPSVAPPLEEQKQRNGMEGDAPQASVTKRLVSKAKLFSLKFTGRRSGARADKI